MKWLVWDGSQSAARSIATTADGGAAASVAAGERHVAVWLAAGKPSKKTRSAAGGDFQRAGLQWL